ncbi:MAG: fibronectin type III domain-containing protein, partial [Thermoplasmata archaeon]
NLNNGQVYYYQISARNDVGEGPKSDEVQGIPLAHPSSPYNVRLVSGDSFVNLSWDAPEMDGGTSITGYFIYKNNTKDRNLNIIEIGNSTNYNDSNITNGVTYSYMISAVNIVGEGPASEDINATPRGAPWAPRELHAASGDSFVFLQWNSPESDEGSPIINYTVFRRINGEEYSFLDATEGVAHYNDSRVENGISYFYKVRAVNGVGEGNFSPEVDAIPMGLPDTPENLSAVEYGDHIKITWNVPLSDGGSNITLYRIYKGTASGDYETTINAQDFLFVDDYFVNKGETYYYCISSINQVGESPLSMEVSASLPIEPDTDKDGIPDSEDTDDDNDGYLDINDDFPKDPLEWLDTDSDDIGDNADPDDDNDGHLDENDLYPTDPDRWRETEEPQQMDMFLILTLIIVSFVAVLLSYIFVFRKSGGEGGEPTDSEEEVTFEEIADEQKPMGEEVTSGEETEDTGF